MASRYFSIPVPSLPGTGTAVNVSDLGPSKSLIIDAAIDSWGDVAIEGSCDGGISYAPILSISLLQDPALPSLAGVFTHLRAVRQTGAGSVSISAGGTISDTAFSSFNVPPTHLPGTALSTVDFGEYKTVVVSGSYIGAIVIEGSCDGSSYDPIATLRSGSSQVLNLVGNYLSMRISRRNSLIQGGAVTIALGGSPGSSAGSSDIVADYQDTSPRWIAFDNENGNDSNLGYSDISMSDAFNQPLKTWQRGQEIVNQLGAGRQIIFAFKPRSDGGIYLDQNGAQADLVWRGVPTNSYRYVAFQGTSDGSDSATDKIRAGGLKVITGPNADGSWTIGAGTTTTVIVAASGTITADAGVGYRIRMTSGALAERCQMIKENNASATPSFYLDGPMNGTPAQGDTFVIETAGVRFKNVLIEFGGAGFLNQSNSAANFLNAVGGIKGLSASENFIVTGPVRRYMVCFCEATGSSAQVRFDSSYELIVQGTFTDYLGTSQSRVGYGFRTPSSFSIRNIFLCALSQSGFLGQVAGVQVQQMTIGLSGACAFAKGLTNGTANAQMNIGSFGLATLTATRFYGITSGQAPIEYFGTGSSANIDIYGCTFENIVGVPIVRLRGNSLSGTAPRASSSIHMDACSNGNAGNNTDVVLDVQGSIGGYFRIGVNSANTVTATVGDMRLAGAVIASFADLAITNVVDERDNNVIGTAGSIVGKCTRVTNKQGSALAAGDAVRGNGTAGQVVKAQADSAPNASNFLGTMATSPANNADGYMTEPGDVVVAQFDGAPSIGVAYLSTGTAGQMTTTVPVAPNQKLRMGVVISTTSGNKAKLSFRPEIVPVAADGNP